MGIWGFGDLEIWGFGDLGGGGSLFTYSPTAESFGVSAQIGSGVVRGDPELRFHQGSTRVPPGFHQGSTRVPPGFHQGSTRVPPGFHQVLQGRGGLGWFEVRFHEGSTRVPPISSRAAGLRKVLRFHKALQGFHTGSTRLHQGCVVRPSSEKPSNQDRFAHGRNTKQNRNQWFLAHFHCFVTCSLAKRSSCQQSYACLMA